MLGIPIISSSSSGQYIFEDESIGQAFIAQLDTVILPKRTIQSVCPNTTDEATVYWMYSDKDSRPGIRVSICPHRAKDAHASRFDVYKAYGIDRRPTLTACIPAIFSTGEKQRKKRIDASQQMTLELTSWIERFLKYYAAQGVDFFFLYSLGSATPLKTSVPHVWIDMSWALNVTKSSERGKKGMWYHGQYWSINDCLYRNKVIGGQWMLLQDYDEVFFSKKNLKLTDTIRTHGNGVDSIMIGNYPGSTRDCVLNETQETWSSCERFERSALPECRASGIDPFMCTGWRGRRKHIDRVDSVFLTKVHKLLVCRQQNCRVEDLNAKEFWLDHYRGQPYQQGSKKCICL